MDFHSFINKRSMTICRIAANEEAIMTKDNWIYHQHSSPSSSLLNVPLLSEETVQKSSEKALQPQSEHSQEEKKPLAKAVHVCPECGKSFSKPAYLKNHVLSHGSEKMFVCAYVGCSKAYTRKDHLKRHELTVHEAPLATRDYQCPVCEATFAYKHGLTRHLHRAHDNANRPYQCPSCPLAFKKKYQLQKHRYEHTGTLPFQCSGCGKGFLFRSKLNAHEATHAAKEDWFKCKVPTCHQLFNNVIDRDLHMDLNHADFGNERVLCELCDKSFSTPSNLRSHLKKCHVTKNALDAKASSTTMTKTQYICPFAPCQKMYTTKFNLQTHIRARHTPCTEGYFCPLPSCHGRSFQYRTSLQRHLIKVHQSHLQDPSLLRQPLKSLGKAAGFIMEEEAPSNENIACAFI